jgi:hypothetical protein
LIKASQSLKKETTAKKVGSFFINGTPWVLQMAVNQHLNI